MNLEEFGPDAKDEMSPSEYIQYCLEQYREYRILASDPTINSQAAKLYLEKASDYYARAQEAMDEIEPDMTDHLSDEDKALPNKSLADQENELNNENTNEMLTKQYRQFEKWADDSDKVKANKAKMDAELSDEDKATIKKYEDDKEEQENSETNKIDAAMYRESVDLNRWAKLAGINEALDAQSLIGKYVTLSQSVGMSGYHPKTAQDVIDIMPKFTNPLFGIKIHDTDPGRASWGSAVYLIQQDGSLKMVSDNYDTSGQEFKNFPITFKS